MTLQRVDGLFTCPLQCNWVNLWGEAHKFTTSQASSMCQHLTVAKYHPGHADYKGVALHFTCKDSSYTASGIVGRQTLD